ncbi:uncharacterized protein LOC124161530 isoform X1 [Ischnura elegans]|uniref:uncharacterized protein LOC124161530 isoform X1 n=1 Tax=Ischnura elegans TaxID=197161 RepID=UPI001ED89D1E|nr:uncharacterized protein LOC124161530 isoform X1 [Ischnura elegans]XP_046393845.1 uncharacterized protein LOC124161530 isoform X1 [Ischnura elegans]XP_046393846.1 uncharacterized protein LOC124161530 isoform X1 [Ischnura elegans]XP_046393847.1 uncharacterized protein LOC124161530 isoform X1 [Ischnura elegans]
MKPVDILHPLASESDLDDESIRSGERHAYSEADSDVSFSDSEVSDADIIFEDDDSTSGESVSSSSFPPFENLRSYQSEYNSMLTPSDTKLSVGEILLMVLSMASMHNFSLSAIVDITKMLNVIFNTTSFPETRYLFKKIFNPKHKMDVHILCNFCEAYLGQKPTDKANSFLVCSHCGQKNNVNGYSYDYSFVTIGADNQIREIIKEFPQILDRELPAGDAFSDFCDGSNYQQGIQESSQSFISCTFNCDGTPISNCSSTSIWPIYPMINELPIEVRCGKMVLAGLWYGKMKPKMRVFLKQFVESMNTLREKGLKVKLGNVTKNVKVFTLCCCVDSVARPPMQGISDVRGFGSCSWCLHPGECVEHSLKFPYKNPGPPARTESNFRSNYMASFADKKKVMGVTAVSALINLEGFSMIWGFVPDYMHCCLLGIVKRFLNSWLSHTGKQYYIGSQANVSYLDSLEANISPPQMLKRLPVILTNRNFMKAREYENWFLFYSVPLLQGTLPTKFLNHWKLLVKSIRILPQNRITSDEVDESQLMLEEFVNKTEVLYGKNEMTYNIHQLLHLPESVRRWGPLWAHNGYPFECENGCL